MRACAPGATGCTWSQPAIKCMAQEVRHKRGSFQRSTTYSMPSFVNSSRYGFLSEPLTVVETDDGLATVPVVSLLSTCFAIRFDCRRETGRFLRPRGRFAEE